MKKKEIIILGFLFAILAIILVFVQVIMPKMDDIKKITQENEQVISNIKRERTKEIAQKQKENKLKDNLLKLKNEFEQKERQIKEEIEKYGLNDTELKEKDSQKYIKKIEDFLYKYGLSINGTEGMALGKPTNGIYTIKVNLKSILEKDTFGGYIVDESEINKNNNHGAKEIYERIVEKDQSSFIKKFKKETKIYKKTTAQEDFKDDQTLETWALGGIDSRLYSLTYDLLNKKDEKISKQMFVTSIEIGTKEETKENGKILISDKKEKDKYLTLKEQTISGYKLEIKFIILE